MPDNPFETEIRKFEEQDRQMPPPPDAVLFAGSSTFTMWTSLAADFAPLKVINRGFGGSAITDVLHFMDRIVIPCRPAKIVFYCGDNDLAGGATAAQVAERFQEFVRRCRAGLPKVRILFIAIKPSPSRWSLQPAMAAANGKIREWCRASRDLGYLDIVPVMVGADGQPRRELYLDDQLHMSRAGYELWIPLIRRALGR
jgi:lysophospholipase L1-like esterase